MNIKSAHCRVCDQDFKYQSRKGRPPTVCDPCKVPVDEPVSDDVELDGEDHEIDWGGPHKLGTIENEIAFKKNDMVKISGENGRYQIYRDDVNKDGSYTLYGGSADPGGIRGFRAIMPSRLSYDKRKKIR